MRRKIIPDHLAVLHHEPNPLQFVTVGERIARDDNEVCKFLRPTTHTLAVHVFSRGLDKVLWLSFLVAVRSYGSSCLVIDFTDGIDDSVRIVELDIFRAVGHENLLCIGREGK
jgi:hypothetical protein